MCQITQIGGGELSSDNTGGRDEVKHNLFLSSCLCCVITDSSSPETAASEKPSLPLSPGMRMIRPPRLLFAAHP